MRHGRLGEPLSRGASLWFLAAVLSGCGQRGPLVLPEDAQPIEPAPPAASPSAEPESESQDERENER